MKAIRIFAAVAAASLLAVSCSLFNKSTATTDSTASTETTATTTTTDAATAQSNGQSAGTALKSLYASYVANGKKLDLSNATNLLTAAALMSSIQDLKSTDATYKKSFAKGLVLGSTGLVEQDAASAVTTTLGDLATTVAGSEEAQEATTTAQSAANKTASVLSNASTISTALGSIFGSLGK